MVLLSAEPQRNSGPQSAVFTHVTVIDATGAPAQPDMTVVVTGDRIADLGQTGKVHVPKGAPVIDARGKFLIPGLWDMHAHLEVWGKEAGLPLYVANGVTGVRDMGGDWDLIRSWREQIAQGSLTGPRIVAAGPILDGPTPGYPLRLTVKNAAEARQAVDSLKRRGVDFIKVHAHLSRESYLAIADEAKKQGLPFAGHITRSVTAAEASDLGQKSIEHLNESQLLVDCSSQEADLRQGRGGPQQYLDTYSEEKCQALFKHFRQNGTWQDPTLVTIRLFAYLDEVDLAREPRMKYIGQELKDFSQGFIDTFFKRRTKEEWATAKKVFQKDLELVGAMHRTGVEILAGTDLGFPYVFPGFSLHDELRLLVTAGLTPLAALQAATAGPARFFGREKDLGTVQKGKIADLVLLDADPLRDIQNTTRIHAVVANGRLLDRKTLDRMLVGAEAAVKPKSK